MGEGPRRIVFEGADESQPIQAVPTLDAYESEKRRVPASWSYGVIS
jgi:hypothetical protein